jgi:CheY-like chemotaxis protein
MMQILVVDDDRDLARLLAYGLRSRGYLAEVAENGKEALSLLEKQRFDALVVDWNMPVMGGEQFLRERRLRASAPTVPIVVITGEPAAEQQARQLGAAAVLAKPFRLDDIVHLLARVLGDAT